MFLLDYINMRSQLHLNRILNILEAILMVLDICVLGVEKMLVDNYGCEFYTLHLPGHGKEYLSGYLRKYDIISVNEKVTVITVATDEVKDECPLIHQLDDSGISYINAAKYKESKEWKHTDKIGLILKALDEVATPYVLIMDANDALILKDIDDGFIEKWKRFDCEILYNASDMLYPPILGTAMESESPFIQHYLNAGVCFGLTEYAKSVYQTAYEEFLHGQYAPYDSEQYYIRISWMSHDRMKIDNRSNLFLLSHGR